MSTASCLVTSTLNLKQHKKATCNAPEQGMSQKTPSLITVSLLVIQRSRIFLGRRERGERAEGEREKTKVHTGIFQHTNVRRKIERN